MATAGQGEYTIWIEGGTGPGGPSLTQAGDYIDAVVHDQLRTRVLPQLEQRINFLMKCARDGSTFNSNFRQYSMCQNNIYNHTLITL